MLVSRTRSSERWVDVFDIKVLNYWETDFFEESGLKQWMPNGGLKRTQMRCPRLSIGETMEQP